MTTTQQPLGTVLRDGDQVGLRYERRLRHSPDKVWRALTESEHLAQWMPCDMVGERRQGARIELPFWSEVVARYELDPPSVPGTIRVWDPPRVFEWTWDTDLLRWELEPTDEGTLLVLTTWLGDAGTPVANTAAGYHVCLDHLVELLDTGHADPVAEDDPTAWEARYRDVV